MHGQQAKPSDGCCPIGMYSWGYSGHNFVACAGQPNYNPSINGFGFPSGASTPVPMFVGNLTSYKDAWTTYGNINNGFGNIPGVNIGGCTSSAQATYTMPPFVEDRVSVNFSFKTKHFYTNFF